MAFDLDQFKQAISVSPAVSRVLFPEDKMTSTFTSEEKANIYTLKRAVKLAMIENDIGTYSNGNMVIAGGFFSTMFGESSHYNDLDVFILNNQGLFENCINDGPIKWMVRKNNDNTARQPYFHNPHILATAKNTVNKVQFILTDYNTREELIAGFDFVHCTISYDTIKDVLYITRRAYDANRNKHLINNSKTAAPAQTWRVQKFLDRGWQVPPAKTVYAPYGSPLGVGVTAVPLLYNQTA